MSDPARREDDPFQALLALPENVVGEIIAGTLHTQPRPAAPHALVALGLGADLHGPFDRGRGGPGGWILMAEPELHLGDDVLVPDLAGWRVERLPADAFKAAFQVVAPDWVAEIASPSTSRFDRLLKMPLYAKRGVQHLWLVEPLEAWIEAFERSGDSWMFLGHWGDEREARIPPFEAVALELPKLWERTRT